VTTTTTRFYYILFLIFVFCGFLVYAQIITSFFLSDDFISLYEIRNVSPFWTAAQGPFFRPLLSLSLICDHTMWSLNATGYHATNIIIHSINSYLVFLITILLLNTSSSHEKRTWTLALLSGFIFLILPSHTEAVAWISGRTDVIAAFFCILSFYLYLLYKQHSKVWYVPISILLFFCALLSKESVIALPFVILAYEVYSYCIKRTNSRNRTSVLYVPLLYCCALALYLLTRFAVIGTIIGGYGGGKVHLNVHLLRIFRNVFFYSMRTFLPPMPDMFTIVLIFIGIVSVVILLIAWSASRWSLRIPTILYFLAIAFIISLVPVINLGISLITTQGERFIYLPSLFFSILMIVVLDYIIRNRRYFTIVFICLFLFYGVSIYFANKNWRTAGSISKQILYSLKAIEGADRLFIINLPDNTHGAYIYRNGIREALSLFGNTDQFKNVITISFNNVYDMDDVVEVQERFGLYSVRLLNPRASFIRFSKPQKGDTDSGSFEIENAEKRSFDLRLKNLNHNDKLVYYSSGIMELYRF